jgi:hypothetical protein
MMRYLPGLSLIERFALWILVRSPRTSLVVVKELHWPAVFTAADPTDDLACYVTNGRSEPVSMQLERLYHLPAHGEEE